MKRGYLPFMIIVAGCITGEMILLLGEKTDMTIAEWIAIIVAAIGLVGGIWTQIVQFHKDAQRIESVNKTANDVKADTTDMKPRVSNIEKHTLQLRDNMMVKSGRIDEAINGVSELVNAYRVEYEIKNRVSYNLISPDYLLRGIKAVYDENARLNSLNQELSSENILLKNQVAALTAEGEALKIQNNELKGKLEGLSERDIIQ